MLPNWMYNEQEYAPPKAGGAFINKTIQALGKSMSKLKTQRGHEKKHAIPALLKMVVLFCFILLVSISHNRLILMAAFALVQLYLCLWPAKDIWTIMKTAFLAAFLALIIVLPAMITNPEGLPNNVILVLKVFVSMEMVNIFNHTTQWNHITAGLRKLHVPGIFIFTLDITLKYIVLLGQLINDLLTAMSLRAVGKNKKEYQSIGGVMGVTFLRSVEMSQEMYDAMKCRGFTDDYKGL